MEEKFDKNKAIESLISQVDKQFGKNSLMKLGQRPAQTFSSISTGALTLDIALGIGGIPRGRIVEIYGPESSGKTTLALNIVANAQKMGGSTGFIDAEHALDPQYAKLIGVDIENVLISQPSSGEEALEILDYMVRSNALDVVVVDSVAALVPKAEIEGDMGDPVMGSQARLMSQALRKLAGSISKSNTSVLFINQIRQKIGVMFGNPETTTGGNALKFYASVRMDIRRTETLKKGQDPIGNHVRVKIVKNKTAPPFKTAEFDIFFNEGISREGCLLELASDTDVINKAGTWYSYKDEKIGQGKENARQFLIEHPEITNEVEEIIRAKNNLPPRDKTLSEKLNKAAAKPEESDNTSKKSTSTTAKKKK